MQLEDKIEKEQEKNDRLALEIANLRAKLRVLSSTAQLSNQDSRAAQRAVREIDALFDAPLPELLRQKGESDKRLASLKRMLHNRRVAAFAGYEAKKQPSEPPQAALLRGLAARLATSGSLPAQQARAQSNLGMTDGSEDKKPKTQLFVRQPMGSPRSSRERGPDLKKARERVDFEDKLRTELASIKAMVGKGCETLADLKNEFPMFELWKLLGKKEQPELLTEVFKPQPYARSLVMRKYGLTNPDTVKKYRSKLRRAGK